MAYIGSNLQKNFAQVHALSYFCRSLSAMSIKVQHLTKVYDSQKAVDNISFEVNEGEILGFLGPNGAGKSTTMKIATCYLPPSEGTIEVRGYDVQDHPMTVRKNIGYLPENNPLYLEMYVREYLGFVGRLHGLKGKTLKHRIEEMLQLCGLLREQGKKVQDLSKGYRQRVGLAQALIHDPKVLILDEPTTGLDPNQLVEIRKLIKDISADKTVILSTHIMQEVQALCDRVVVINKGKIVADDSLTTLTQEGASFQYIRAEFDNPVPLAVLNGIQGVLDVKEEGGSIYQLKSKSTIDIRAEVFRFAVAQDRILLGLQLEKSSMENVFRTLTQQKGGVTS